MTPRPAVRKPAMTKKTRTSVASIARYSAIPPQTPPMTRLVALRSRRCDDTCTLPSLRELVRRREEGRREERDRHRRLLREDEHTLERHGDAREERDRTVEPIRGEGRHLRRDGDRDEEHERAHRERGDRRRGDA